MLKMALVMTVLVSSTVAYALDNSDLIQLNLRISRQQEGQQADVKQLLETRDQARREEEKYRQDQIWQLGQEHRKQQQYLREVLLEWQRRQDAHRIEEQRERKLLMQRASSALFQ